MNYSESTPLREGNPTQLEDGVLTFPITGITVAGLRRIFTELAIRFEPGLTLGHL
jgi:hypothetical protein